MIGLRQNSRGKMSDTHIGKAWLRHGRVKYAVRANRHADGQKIELDKRRRPGLEEKDCRGWRVVKHCRRKVMHQRHDQYEMEKVGFYGFLSDGGTNRTLVLVVDRNARRLGPFQMLPVIGRVAGNR